MRGVENKRLGRPWSASHPRSVCGGDSRTGRKGCRGLAWNDTQQPFAFARGDLLLGCRLRLQLRRILPARVFPRRRTAVDISIADFQKRLLAQLGQELARLRLHARSIKLLCDLILNFFKRRETLFMAFFHFEDDESVLGLHHIREVASLLLE